MNEIIIYKNSSQKYSTALKLLLLVNEQDFKPHIYHNTIKYNGSVLRSGKLLEIFLKSCIFPNSLE